MMRCRHCGRLLAGLRFDHETLCGLRATSEPPQDPVVSRKIVIYEDDPDTDIFAWIDSEVAA